MEEVIELILTLCELAGAFIESPAAAITCSLLACVCGLILLLCC